MKIIFKEINYDEDDIILRDYHKLEIKIIHLIIITLNSQNWGIIDYNFINNKNNKLFELQVMFQNYYFHRMSNLRNDIFIINILNITILHKLILKLISIKNIDNKNHNCILNEILLNSYYYIDNGLKIQILNIEDNIPVDFDYLNSPSIQNDNINNYYKNIQEDTIIEILKFNILEFNNKNTDRYIDELYDNITKSYDLTDEYEIGKIFFNYTILRIFNCNNIHYNLVSKFEYYCNEVINLIIYNLKYKLLNIEYVLGGRITNKNLSLSTNFIQNLFSNQIKKFYDINITVFTLIYNEFELFNNNDLLIILFYNTVLITYLLTNEYIVNNETILKLCNLININIVEYIRLVKLKEIIPVNLEIFFDKLNILLFEKDTNEIYIKKCNIFFKDTLFTVFDIDLKLNKQLLEFNNRTWNNTINSFYLMDNNIKNNKIEIWKNMLGIIVDYNKSDIIKSLKSSSISNYHLNLQNNYVNYIIKLHKKLINKFGLLQIINNVELTIDSELIDSIDNL
jgi:hypothetical protein